MGIGTFILFDGYSTFVFFFNPHVGVHFRLPDSKLGLNVCIVTKRGEQPLIIMFRVAVLRMELATIKPLLLSEQLLKAGFSF